MAFTYYPFDGVPTTEAQYTTMFRRMLQDGVVAAHGANSLEVFGDSSGMQVKVRSGEAAVRGHYFTSSAQETIAISAAGASVRYDYIVLKLDPTANTITLTKVQGTAGAGVPALTQTATGTYELPLALVQIDAGAITIAAAKVTDMRTYSGLQITTWTTATRPGSTGLGSAVKGQIGYNATTGKHEYHNGTTWVSMSPDETQVASGTVTHTFSGQDAVEKTITFPASRFTAAPSVVTNLQGSAGHTGNISTRPHTITASGCKLDIYDWEGDNISGGVTVLWIAVYEP